MSLHADDELVALVKSGNEAAFAEIYERYWSVLFLHARNLLREDEEAADIVQELFTTLWKNSSTLNLSHSLSGYLYKAVRNKVFDHLKRRKVINSYLSSINDFMAQGQLTPDHVLREKELATIIEKEIDALPAKMREVFILSRKQHLSYQQIAMQLNISEHTVKSQVSNALKILKVKLGPLAVFFFF